MALDIGAAYAQLKALENAGNIAIPQPREVVQLGIVDPAAGTFSWSVPTLVQTLVVPPLPPARTNTVTNITVGVVATKAVDLQLRIAVIPQQRQAVFTSRMARHAVHVRGGGEIAELWNGGVTVNGYPVVANDPNGITIDVGHDLSTIVPNDPYLTPAVNRLGIVIAIPGHPPITVPFFVLRPPVLGMGAFTLPALPMTIVYAPPQGASKQNKVSYSDNQTLSRTITTAVSSSTTTRTAAAYGVGDLITKAGEAIAAVAAVVGTGGAAGPTLLGAIVEAGQAIGAIKTETESIADSLKTAKDELTAFGLIIQGLLPSTSTPGEIAVKTEQDHSVTLSTSSLSQYEAKTGLGPGVGDRIIFMNNVRVAWMVINGEVNLVILGYERVVATAVQDLQADLRGIAAGQPSSLDLDADTIKYLLGLDPLVPPSGPRVIGIGPGVHVGPAVVGPPRYTPADPPGRAGTGTGPDGDIFEASFDTTIDNVQVTTYSHTTITDVKPGWLSVLCGADDNVETVTTAVLTTTQTTDDRSDDKITSTVTLFSQGNDDPYNVKIFYDRTFGTYAVLDAGSPLLQGINGSLQGVLATAGRVAG